MIFRTILGSMIAGCTVLGACLPCLAAPSGARIHFTPPLADAKTIQVTEVIWQPANGKMSGPLQKTGTITYQIQRPDKFRMGMIGFNSAKRMSYTVSDGTTLVSYGGKEVSSRPAATSEWPYPMMGLLNNMPGPVSAVRGMRNGKQVLVAVRTTGPSRSEYVFDPKTHLLNEFTLYMTEQGKTFPFARTAFSGWVLNKTMSPTLFRAPSSVKLHK